MTTKIKFPFTIKQVGDNEVEIVIDMDGEPLLTLGLHRTLWDLIPDKLMDKIHDEAVEKIIRHSLKIV